MLEIAGLTARVGRFELADVSLRVPTGACHVVLGPSGAGKTTLLRAILGQLRLSAGRVLWDGEEIQDQPLSRRRLGYLPQGLALFPHLSVRENLLYSARATRRSWAEVEPLLTRMVATTGIADLVTRMPGTLSGGEAQRVALVRALLSNPRVVLLDEPFASLDPHLRHELWWLLKDLQAEWDLSVLLITHDLAEAQVLADEITVLVGGRVAQAGPLASLRRRPSSVDVAHVLGLRSLFPAVVIGVLDGRIVVDCPVLGGALSMAGPAAPGARIWVGSRPEGVAILDAGRTPRTGERRITGAGRVLDLGTELRLILRPAGSAASIELAVSRSRAGDASPGQDASLVTVGVLEDQLFWVPRDGPLSPEAEIREAENHRPALDLGSRPGGGHSTAPPPHPRQPLGG